jgi:phospholipid/cholesterol/gamma-HCH transport system substrate-binding protein
LKLSREFKVSVLVISSILLFYWGFMFLKGRNLFDNSTKLNVTYDNVAGLAASAPVTLNGLAIGKVNSISVLPDGKMKVEMIITNDEIKIAKNAIAEIKDSGLIGGKEIAILNDFKATNLIESGDSLQGNSKLGLTDNIANQLEPIKVKVEKLIDNANLLFANINNTLDAQTQNNLKESMAALKVTLTEFGNTAKSANSLIADNKNKLSSTLANFDKTSANLNKITDSISKADLSGTIKKLEKTLGQVNGLMADMNQGKGTMGKLMKDETMYNNFSKSAKELELLLQDLRLNPTRYVNVSLFGKKNKEYVAPKEEQKAKSDKD